MKPTLRPWTTDDKGTSVWPVNPLDQIELVLSNRIRLERRTGFTSAAVQHKAQLAAIQELRKAACLLADIAHLHGLYEGHPCFNERHADDMMICYQQHGAHEVLITLGQCRKVAKLLKSS